MNIQDLLTRLEHAVRLADQNSDPTEKAMLLGEARAYFNLLQDVILG